MVFLPLTETDVLLAAVAEVGSLQHYTTHRSDMIVLCRLPILLLSREVSTASAHRRAQIEGRHR
jgi:hypothetical protein